MADRLTQTGKRVVRVVRQRPALQRAVHTVTEAVRTRPVLVDALSRLAALEGEERILPLATPGAAAARRAELFPQDPAPERWPVVGVETHHLDPADEESALAALAGQQLENPWFRPVVLASEEASAAARAAGLPFDLVPAHAATPAVVGQRVADLVTGFGATLVLRATPTGLAPEHLEALTQVATRRREARRRRAERAAAAGQEPRRR